ncbi:exodeoxyribonuclease V subunit alpha [Endozoicomonas ascidiicola]|uniref:exodeoxyribonuclease V subunit alpha n=1 Tax=Endozoicomonas ascidiicola TaxID=1698521 RepID=UPI0008343998|nr:exodeoxyribonuclease V subunit alpha [Endozoicomonas ascidiicola]
MLNHLQLLEQQGTIRPLDYQFARLIYSMEPNPLITLLAANVSFELGLGNVCMPIDTSSPKLFALSADEGEQLIHLAGVPSSSWLESLSNSYIIGDGAEPRPLVLDNGRLYLYRYWQYEQHVAGFLTQQHRTSLDQQATQSILQRLFRRNYDVIHQHCVNKSETEQRAEIIKWLDIEDSEQLNWSDIIQAFNNPESLSKLDQLIPESTCLNWQKIAVALAATRSFSVISGGPGTGKTTTVTRLLALLMELGLNHGAPPNIKLVAPTGKAAARLTESIGGALAHLNCSDEVKNKIPTLAGTLHRLLGVVPGKAGFTHNHHNRLHLDILVVDEASMIDLPMMSHLLAALPDHARLILLGDRDQLSSVEAGSVLGDICGAAGSGYSQEQTLLLENLTGHCLQTVFDRSPFVSAVTDSFCLLRKSYRFDAKSGIGSLAKAMNLGQTDQLEGVLNSGFSDIAYHPLSTEGSYQQLISQCIEGYRDYLTLVQHRANPKQILDAFNHFQLLCALREGRFGVKGLNDEIQTALQDKKLLNVTGQWYEGRPVLITRNDHGLGLYNGDIGITVRGADEKLRVAFELPDKQIREVLPSRLPEHETVFAMTIHKSQGSEFANVVLALPDKDNPVITRELVYTGITRAKSNLSVYADIKLLHKAALTPTLRHSGLHKRLLTPER